MLLQKSPKPLKFLNLIFTPQQKNTFSGQWKINLQNPNKRLPLPLLWKNLPALLFWRDFF
jgi:hypothetical protein